MKKYILILTALLMTAFPAFAQNDMTKNDESKVYAADPKDVESVDAILKATYDVISGDAGVERNWDRFYSLFHPGARLIPTGKQGETFNAFTLTPQDYVKRSGAFLVNNGFHEQEIARRVETFGNIVHVFSTYAGRKKLSDEKPFLRGINSFQLLNDGKRWWIITIYWQAQSPDIPLPEKYLKTVE